mmetsp:Transcript_7757/g.15973  ORF Transcript_7757/g.15973 Transcript_7757/m.15973 type:complete len:216 (+) Transcript_7757:763-1410(+)
MYEVVNPTSSSSLKTRWRRKIFWTLVAALYSISIQSNRGGPSKAAWAADGGVLMKPMPGSLPSGAPVLSEFSFLVARKTSTRSSLALSSSSGWDDDVDEEYESLLWMLFAAAFLAFLLELRLLPDLVAFPADRHSHRSMKRRPLFCSYRGTVELSPSPNESSMVISASQFFLRKRPMVIACFLRLLLASWCCCCCRGCCRLQEPGWNCGCEDASR